ncbi:MAG TPA: histidine phosphatase family protein [Bosea sp. (in: a-proteobacteria)]|jgi:probable phosphoglycerate mutase|uniref:histidine phosphatase family protein n=1 Tax=Bosea sp. (in: a-proteobacteria) TaxID=1871050 RepID=UPI002E1478DD|nr:histidine phosphatase family protein [Bosea sp. (in: a-proteobacteria)]
MTDDSKHEPAAPLQIYLVRHGQTEWSLSGQHTGRTDIPLTAHGEDEARALEARFSRLGFAHVLTSPRQRARQTARLAGLGAQATVEADLAEWDYGDYEGQRSVEIRAGRPDWDILRDGCPNGETPAQISARADRMVALLSSLTGKVAVFSHGHFGRCLAARWIGLELDAVRHLLLGTACYGVLGYDPGHPENRVIAQWNIGSA